MVASSQVALQTAEPAIRNHPDQPRDGSGRWLTGASQNPSGRPKGVMAVARAIAEQTGGGAEVVTFHLGVMRDEAQPIAFRLQAGAWLANRLWGKPKESVDVDIVHKQLRIIVQADAPAKTD